MISGKNALTCYSAGLDAQERTCEVCGKCSGQESNTHTSYGAARRTKSTTGIAAIRAIGQ